MKVPELLLHVYTIIEHGSYTFMFSMASSIRTDLLDNPAKYCKGRVFPNLRTLLSICLGFF